MCDTDTRSLIRCSSAATISSVLSQETLDRRSQYRSCLYRTESEFMDNPNGDIRTSSSNIISLLPTSSCQSTDASDDTEELISSRVKSPPLLTKSRVVREAAYSDHKTCDQKFATNPNAFELWLVKKLKLESAEKEKQISLKKTEVEKITQKTARGHSAHKSWVQEKIKLKKQLIENEERETEEKRKLEEEHENREKEKREKAQESYHKWLKNKEEIKNREKIKKE